MIWGPLAADEAETRPEPAQRRHLQRIRVDAPLAGENQFDRAALPFEPQAAFDALTVLRAAIRRTIDPHETHVAGGDGADRFVQRVPRIDAGVRLPAVVDV